MVDKETEDILDKYRKRIEQYIDPSSIGQSKESVENTFSKEYKIFREEVISAKRSKYEEWCNRAERIIKFQPSPKLLSRIKEAIDIAHLDITPTGAASFAALISFITLALAIIIGLFLNVDMISAIISGADISQVDSFLFLPFLLLVLGLISLNIITKVPIFLATRWRLKAGNQMVLCILYIIIYMRHTSNLEHAIKFAAEHIGPPLSLDLRKVFWDVEVGKFSTIKESLDSYLQRWRKYNLEFITAFNLIESSLYEPTETRRITLLEKALKVMLDGTYEKMLHYAQELKSPITTLHMLGVILPILGLVLFPLLGAFLGGLIKWYHLAILYNIILPFIVYSIGSNILSKRPTGYQSSSTEKEVLKQPFNPFWICFFIALLFTGLGLIPILSHALNPDPKNDVAFSLSKTLNFEFLGYKEGAAPGQYYGPFGLGALLISFLIPLGLALAIGFYYKSKTKGLIEIKNETKRLEQEFSSALFQLGNRIGDGVPPEIAFSKVVNTLEDTPAGKFFKIVDINIQYLGMGIKEAIFNNKTGAILAYPSPLVESSMEVLLESSKKGPTATARSLTSISRYIDKIHKVDERLKDLLAEIVSSMKSQTSFLTPAIAGIVVGVSAMVVSIIVNLHSLFSQQLASTGLEGAGMSEGLTTISTIFGIEGVIPGYFFQIVVGLYVVEIGIILTILQNGIENSSDKILGEYLLGKNIVKSAILYTIIAIAVTVLFSLLAGSVITANITGG